mgnify:FL=1
MNDRIKELRKALGLSQDEFGRRLGVTRGAVTNIELNKVEPKPLFVDLICREFNVNELWLREGIGEMFQERTRSEELASFFGDVQAEGGFKEAFLTVLARLGPEEWELIERKARELAEEIKKADP